LKLSNQNFDRLKQNLLEISCVPKVVDLLKTTKRNCSVDRQRLLCNEPTLLPVTILATAGLLV